MDGVLWLFRLIAWDGLLPVIVWLLPSAMVEVFPGRRGPIELAAIVVPIAALFLRFSAGNRFIQTNHCGPVMRRMQLAALCLGLVILVFVDALIMLSHIMPPGQLLKNPADRQVWGVVAILYLLCMAVALFPGSSSRDPSVCHQQDHLRP